LLKWTMHDVLPVGNPTLRDKLLFLGANLLKWKLCPHHMFLWRDTVWTRRRLLL